MLGHDHGPDSPTLFVGITSWNSSIFLGHCLDAVIRTTQCRRTRIVVLDNESIDSSYAIAASRGVEVVRRRCNQADALKWLFNISQSEYTLLIHADVILLSDAWFDLCRKKLVGNIALVSPEDIGCGPYTRPWGKGMPESSFLLFRTDLARSSRRWFWRRRFKLRLPYRAIDFHGKHITYNLPGMLKEHGLGWYMLDVHVSTTESAPIYVPAFELRKWRESWGKYRYGLGNFYSVDGCITHYHNWYERALREVPEDSQETLPPEAGGLPLAYLQAYSRKFLSDLDNGKLVLPVVGHRGMSARS